MKTRLFMPSLSSIPTFAQISNALSVIGTMNFSIAKKGSLYITELIMQAQKNVFGACARSFDALKYKQKQKVRCIMSLGVCKWIIVVLVLSVFLLGNILLIANWLIDTGVCDWAHFVRREFLTGTGGSGLFWGL